MFVCVCVCVCEWVFFCVWVCVSVSVCECVCPGWILKIHVSQPWPHLAPVTHKYDSNHNSHDALQGEKTLWRAGRAQSLTGVVVLEETLILIKSTQTLIYDILLAHKLVDIHVLYTYLWKYANNPRMHTRYGGKTPASATPFPRRPQRVWRMRAAGRKSRVRSAVTWRRRESRPNRSWAVSSLSAAAPLGAPPLHVVFLAPRPFNSEHFPRRMSDNDDIEVDSDVSIGDFSAAFSLVVVLAGDLAWASSLG